MIYSIGCKQKEIKLAMEHSTPTLGCSFGLFGCLCSLLLAELIVSLLQHITGNWQFRKQKKLLLHTVL